MPQKPTVLFDFITENIAIARLARPECANALNTKMARELVDIFTSITSSVRAIILTGAGSGAFCAGADLKERANMATNDWEAQHQIFRSALAAIYNCPAPVIAAVGGAAYGGGLELALGCDFIYASENAKFAMPEATLGIMAGTGGTQNLTRSIGARKAKEILYTGLPFSAQEAFEWGLVNKLCPSMKLLDQATECAQRISQNAPLSLKAIKRAVNAGQNLPLAEGLKIESENYKPLLASADRHEGIEAFHQKRTPNFKGS